MKCELIFYCALIFYLELVASLPYAINAPKYTQNDARPSTQEYIAPQQYWNQRPYNEDSYNYPDKQFQDSNINKPQNYLYNDQRYVPDNQYYGRYPNTQKNPNTNDIAKWPSENKWQNIYGHLGESVYRLPKETLTVTDKKYFNNRGVETKPVLKNLRESPSLQENIVPNKVLVEKMEPSTVSKLELFNPPIPAIPNTPVRYTEEDNYIVKNKIIPATLPKVVAEKKKFQTKISPTFEERYFATSTNPIETIATPAPVSIKTQIQQIISNSKIRDMITSNKSTSRYLVVYPNGTISRVNTLKSVAEQYPNYVLVHAGDLITKPKEHKVKVSTIRPPVTNEANIVHTPSGLSPSVDLPLNALHNENIQTLTSTPNTSISEDFYPTQPNIGKTSNKNLPVDSLPLQVSLSPDMTSSPIEIPAKSIVQLLLPTKPSKPILTKEPVTVESPLKAEETLKLKETLNIEPIASHNITISTGLSPTEPIVEKVYNKSFPVDSLPLQVSLSPDMASSPIEIPTKSVVQLLLPTKPSKPILSSEPVTVKSTPKAEESLKLEETVNTKPIIEPIASRYITTEPVLKPAEQPPLATTTSVISSIPITIPPEAILSPVETLLATTNTSAVKIDIPLTGQLNSTKTEVLPEEPTPLVAEADNQEEIPLKPIPEESLQPTTPSISSIDEIVTGIFPKQSEPLPISPAIERNPEEVSLNILTPNLTPAVELTPSTIVENLIVSQPTTIAQSSPITNEKLPALSSSSVIVTNEVPSSETTITATTVTPAINKTNEQSAAPTTVSEITPTIAVPNETSDTVSPSLLETILLNVPENNTVPYLPGNLDISKVKTNEKPMVWFKTTEDSFWDKLANGANDFDVVYFFNINSPPRVENTISKTVYPNGTVVEEITKTVWDPDTDKSTVTKTTKVIPPDG